MKISNNNQQVHLNKELKEAKPENIELDLSVLDVVDKKNKLLQDAVNQGNLSKNIAETIEKMRKDQPQEAGQEKVKDGETAKCYMPCYDEWGGFYKGEEKGVFGTPILCYRSTKEKEGVQKKGLPGTGGPLCYAPMKEKGLPGTGGPLCYAPMKSE